MKKTKILDGIIAFISAVIIILFINGLLFNKLGITGMGVAEMLFIAVPIIAVLLRRDSITERFNLRLPSVGSFFSAVVLMMGATMWQNAASYIYLAIFGMPKNNDMVFLESFFSDVSPAVVLIVTALIPAIFEELLFRGYIFDCFKGEKNKVAAVIVTSVLFSVIHFDAYKTIPLFIMALALGYITAKTGSVVIPMIFHFINNSMGVISYYATVGQDTETALASISASTYIWYAVAALGGGLVLVYLGSRLLSGKPRKKWMNIVTPIVSGVLFTVGVIGLMFSMMSVPYTTTYTDKIREDTEYTEAFSLKEDGMGVITAQVVCSNKVSGRVEITDSEGEVVYTSANPASGNGVSMKKGEYTVTYSFDIPEEDGVSYDVAASVIVISVARQSV